MFCEIKLNQIKHNYIRNFIQKKVRCYEGESIGDTNKSIIHNVICQDINIQIALAYIYFFKKEFDSEILCPITLSGMLSTEEEINLLAIIFKRVVIPYDENGKPYIIQLKGIKKIAEEVFIEMINCCELNKILSYFVLERPYTEDCAKVSYYEYKDIEAFTKQSDYCSFCNDKYIKHILYNEKNFTCSSFVNVSGFSIDFLNKNKYIYYLSTLVNNLYLFIIEYELNARKYFIKQLRWHI